MTGLGGRSVIDILVAIHHHATSGRCGQGERQHGAAGIHVRFPSKSDISSILIIAQEPAAADIWQGSAHQQ